eukprot:CAMPEP_0185801420 /NCGR_PEP_ID=MMETSP1322-20130828/1424_1 /TAXON_ID=265543 /ORGANISM="Minutocellus polymorphus, Strain RCC2270" /LENGTH=91 /DNA_ID=CAMNT_0028497111 /DNA_START=125 /DNA_END=403 /DNA_ORIENTATION=+
MSSIWLPCSSSGTTKSPPKLWAAKAKGSILLAASAANAIIPGRIGVDFMSATLALLKVAAMAESRRNAAAKLKSRTTRDAVKKTRPNASSL